jgi:hypothetical protein
MPIRYAHPPPYEGYVRWKGRENIELESKDGRSEENVVAETRRAADLIPFLAFDPFPFGRVGHLCPQRRILFPRPAAQDPQGLSQAPNRPGARHN